ncbi:MAG: hypothetical protein JRG91_14150 [Deltaproteobacteria bacterium]|nr:hypothetical protein [Deltaproteobacteria bacterium]
MTLFIRLALVAALALSWGCKGKNTGDADEDAPGDVEDEDAQADLPGDVVDEDGADDVVDDDGGLPPPELLYCHACVWDSDCGPMGECALLDDGKMSCLPACTDECPTGATCVERRDGVMRCAPNDSRCLWSALGADCPSWGCEDPVGSDGFCTHECVSRADCEAGYNRCADRGDGTLVCLEDLPSPFERCGVTEHADGFGSPCTSSPCSDTSFVCTDTIDTALPSFCTQSCTSDTDCGTGGLCVALQGTDGSTRYCVPDECSCLGIVPGSMIDTGLEATGLTRCDLGWKKDEVTPAEPTFRHDRFRLPWFDDVHYDWLRGGVPFAEEAETRLDTSISAGYADVIVEAAEYGGHPIAGGTVSYTPAATDPLAEAVAAVVEAAGGTADLAAYRTDASDVPADLQDAAALVLLAAADAITARDRAVEGTIGDDDSEMQAYFNWTPDFVLPVAGAGLTATNPRTQALLIDDFGYEELYQAGYQVARAVEQADFGSISVGSTTFTFDQPTPAGRVLISDAADTTYEGALADEDILLVIDAGGNDTYRIHAGGNRSIDNPVSIAIDLDGTDLWAYVEVPDPGDTGRLVSDDGGRVSSTQPISISNRARQGAGRMGVGMLFDLGGDSDTYQSLRMSQGFGSLGVGLLWDDGGDDDYLCEAGCQGSAIWGLGILVDRGTGQDDYSAYHVSQGFAYVGAVGILHDEDGPDSYICNQDDVLYPSAQHSGSNATLGQGFGFGRRADIAYGGDGVFMSGGLGILRDLAGDDTYEAAIMAQGTGYWFGLGALLDGAGNDTYHGRWYVLGAGAHYANGLLHDAGGNDNYNEYEDTRLNVTLGGGHDFSNAFLIDDSGDDVYYSPNLSLGAGNDNGFGLFLDRMGTDAYQCSSNFSFGNAVAVRFTPLSVGIFLDSEGTDTYTRPDTTLTVNDSLWTQTRSGASVEHGVGVDVDTAGVPGI